MNITDLISRVSSTEPYDRGTHIMWTDPHISEFLLQAHLNPEVSAASRTSDDIDRTVKMIDDLLVPNATADKGRNQRTKHTATILDLGCGPGLYAERLAERGHTVTGVDFAASSIAYATGQRDRNGSNITYINDDYLNLSCHDEFNIVMMIFCDFGVLVPEDRAAVMQVIHRALKPGGMFVFDAYNERSIERKTLTRLWDMSDGGFWRPDPYILLSESKHFPGQKATLDQHLVIGDGDPFRLYRFWNHYFNAADIEQLFLPAGFSTLQSIENVLAGDGASDVVFYAVTK